ncbi:DUF4190 domain-containing protein [Clostridium tyrobutyricum]|jgi:hypothetical protein|uniref:DUF4190 domain-containing protein n=1 Tax=Clostridium tyrobutyricum TaxID=1519 RepID=UPI0002FB5E3D|nr:DUF4190 domain-containing protein [Clostridium tyrobutyricum]
METNNEVKSKKGIIALILGVIGLIAWALPVIGAPVTIIGLILGIKGRNTNRKKLATAGIILCIIGLFATVVNGAIGSYKGSTGTLFNSNTTQDTTNKASVNTNEVSQETGKVIFCEKVDNNLKPTNVKDTFNINTQFYALFDNKAPFKSSKLKVTIYTMNGNSQSVYYSDEQEIDQDNTIMAIPVNIDASGKYKIAITRSSDDQKLGEGEVTIQ